MSLSLEELPKEEVIEQPYLSYSRLMTYQLCSARYSYQYVIGAKWERKSAALIFGKAIHKAVEEFYRTIQNSGEILSPDKMIPIFDNVLELEYFNCETEIVFKDGENLNTLKQQGAELLSVFHSEVKPQKIVAVEVPFSVKIPDLVNGEGFLPIRLVGYFDLVEGDSDGSYLVVELKTSSQRFSTLKLEHDLQSTVYSYAMCQMGFATSENSTLVRYDVLLKQKKPSMEKYYVSRATEDHRRLVQLMNQIHRAIELRVFYRQNGWQCADCPFAKLCFSDV